MILSPDSQRIIDANVARLVARIGRAPVTVTSHLAATGRPWIDATAYPSGIHHSQSFAHDGTITPGHVRAALATAQAALR